MISLNTKTIVEEIMAVTAMYALQEMPMSESLPLLGTDNLPMLRRFIRQAFAQMVLDLGAEVAECSLDAADVDPEFPYDDTHELLLTLTLRGEAGLSSMQSLAIKRHMEHITALGALLTAAGPSALSTALTLQRNSALVSLYDAVGQTAAPLVRRSAWG